MIFKPVSLILSAYLLRNSCLASAESPTLSYAICSSLNTPIDLEAIWLVVSVIDFLNSAASFSADFIEDIYSIILLIATPIAVANAIHTVTLPIVLSVVLTLLTPEANSAAPLAAALDASACLLRAAAIPGEFLF